MNDHLRMRIEAFLDTVLGPNVEDGGGYGLEYDVRLAVAKAWDQGYRSGHSNAMRRMSDEPNAPTTPNPYADGIR